MPTYFHTLPKQPGLTAVPDAACQYLAFDKLVLAAGERFDGAVPADREVVLVLLSGRVDVEVGNRRFDGIGGRPSVFAGPAHSLYLPRGCQYRITALTAMEAALPSGPSDLDAEPYEIRPDQVSTGQWGTLNFTRYFRQILVEPDGRPASSLIVGETITPSGNWSTYPAHKHEVEEGAEKMHEEMYYFRVSSPDGYGLIQHYSPERGFDSVYRVTDDTLLSIPYGYHTYAGAPGSTSYYLWALAGKGRTQGASFDPKIGWVQKTVEMA